MKRRIKEQAWAQHLMVFAHHRLLSSNRSAAVQLGHSVVESRLTDATGWLGLVQLSRRYTCQGPRLTGLVVAGQNLGMPRRSE